MNKKVIIDIIKLQKILMKKMINQKRVLIIIMKKAIHQKKNLIFYLIRNIQYTNIIKKIKRIQKINQLYKIDIIILN